MIKQGDTLILLHWKLFEGITAKGFYWDARGSDAIDIDTVYRQLAIFSAKDNFWFVYAVSTSVLRDVPNIRLVLTEKAICPNPGRHILYQ